MSVIYKQIHKHAGSTCSEGAFAKTNFDLNSSISHGHTVIITWNGVSRTYTFVDDGTGVDHYRASTSRANTNINIGGDIKTNTMNLVAAIHTNVRHVAGGQDDTIFPLVSQTEDSVDVYSQSKITGNVTVTGSAVSSSTVVTTGAPSTGVYSTNKGYTGIMITSGTIGGIVTVQLLVRNIDTSGTPGAPENNLRRETVDLIAGELYHIETYGCNSNATLFG